MKMKKKKKRFFVPRKCQASAARSSTSLRSSALDHFNALDDFALCGIFDWLDLDDLVSMAQLSVRYKELIEVHYIRGKYQLHAQEITIILNQRSVLMAPHMNGAAENIFGIIAAFGHTFTRLKVHIHPIGLAIAGKLSAYVNRLCADAKQEVVVHMALKSDKLFTFNNATRVTLDGLYMALGNVNLNGHFPRMQQLLMIETHQFTMLVGHFAHLTGFALRVPYDVDDFSEPRRFLRANSQLRRVEIPVSRRNQLLRYAKEVLPRLKWTVVGRQNIGFVPNH